MVPTRALMVGTAISLRKTTSRQSHVLLPNAD